MEMSDSTFDVDDDDMVVSVANGRCPTLKDLAAKIKQLEGENFQLRVRIYMNEQTQDGGDPYKFDAKSKNKLAEEFQAMKKERDELIEKYNTLKTKGGDLETQMAAVSVKDDEKKGEETIAIYKEKVTSMTKALVDMGTKYSKLEEQQKLLVEQNQVSQKAVQDKDDEVKGTKEELTQMRMQNDEMFRQIHEYQETIHKLTTDMNIQRAQEEELKERQLQMHSQQMGNLLSDNQTLLERLRVADDALKSLNHEHSKLVVELRLLRSGYANNVHNLANGNDTESGQNGSSSPDLGIESGQDIASEGNLYAENARLRNYNRQLLLKLQEKSQQLDRAVKRLTSTTKHNEQMEKAVCRQLHKTHSILKEARLSLEQKQSQQTLNNLLPPSV